MEIQLITQKNYENLLKFSSPSLTTRYDRFVMVLDGAYSLSVDGESKTYIIRKNEIAFVTPLMCEKEARAKVDTLGVEVKNILRVLDY